MTGIAQTSVPTDLVLKVTLNVWIQCSWQIIFPSAWESHHRCLPTAEAGMQPKLPPGRLSQQGMWVPTTIRTKCHPKKMKNTKLERCPLCREGKETFFPHAEGTSLLQRQRGKGLSKPRASSALLRTSLQSIWCPNVPLQHQEGIQAGKTIPPPGYAAAVTE